jgi:hypothetical protein
VIASGPPLIVGVDAVTQSPASELPSGFSASNWPLSL